MLPSCFNLAGCNSISYEAEKQSRQVLRRRFGVIRPYLFFSYKRKQIQTCIVVTVYYSTTVGAMISAVTEFQVLLDMTTSAACFA